MDWLNRLSTLAIALAGIAIAWAQLRITHIRLTHDLFERRYAVFAAARKFIQEICQKRTVTLEELSSFNYACVDAIFVLDEALATYLQQLGAKATRVARLYDMIGAGTASQAEIQEHWGLLQWLEKQIDALTERFKPFLQYKRSWSERCLGRLRIGIAALAFSFPVCQSKADGAFLPPTATEAFHLRSECAALGQKILDSNIIGSALTQSQVSHYEPRTNHCYVELIVETADLTKLPLPLFRRYLSDGQTGEMLAYAEMKGGQPWSGMVYDQAHTTTTLNNAGWDDANQYINAMMADDRKP